MKTKNYEQLLNELKECVFNGCEATRVEFKLESDDDGIVVYPDNDARMLSSIENIVDFCRVKKLSNYCILDNIDGVMLPAVHIF